MESLIRPIEPGERFHVHTIPLHLVDRFVAVYKLTTFIETGTYLGKTTAEVRDKFELVHTIELDPALVAQACERFKNTNVIVHGGSSSMELPHILRGLGSRQALVWLDAHWSGGITARWSNDVHTAVEYELAALAAAPRRDHVIMIDDLDDFRGKNGYPTVQQTIDMVRVINPAYDIHTLDLRRGVLVALPPTDT